MSVINVASQRRRSFQQKPLLTVWPARSDRPCFVSEEFETFLHSIMASNTSHPPYHPATDGLAERAVQIVKA